MAPLLATSVLVNSVNGGGGGSGSGLGCNPSTDSISSSPQSPLPSDLKVVGTSRQQRHQQVS